MSAQTTVGTAAAQAALWGARARDWAEVQELAERDLFEAILPKIGVTVGTRFLDVGCASGVACAVAARIGATVAGFDAAEPLIAIARERVPHGDFRSGEMEMLPYTEDDFDVVTGFNSFQYAADPVHALREARRVARPGAPVAIIVWGAAEACEAAAYIRALGSFLPPPPPGTPGPFALSAPGALEGLATAAGLTPTLVDDIDTIWEYPDLTTALRGLLAGGPAVKAIAMADEARVRDAVTQAIAPYRQPAGSYQITNRWHALITAA